MRKLSNVQVLRGLAALAVVVFHAREEVDGVGIPTRLPGLLGGAFGVDVFFVVSGLVMVYASVPLFGAARSALPFMGRRLARIVPLYWTVTLLFAAFQGRTLIGTMGHRGFAGFLGSSLGFVPYLWPVDEDSWPLYPLGWTLDYEMAFYLGFALVLGLPRRRAIVALAASLSALVVLGKAVALPTGLAYLASTQVLEFVAGTVLAELALSGVRLRPAAGAALAAAGVAAMLAALPWTDAWWGAWRGLVWGLPAAAVVGGFALCPPDGAAGPVRRWFERLGDASYALYLVHYGLYMSVEALLGRALDLAGLPAVPFMLALVALAVGSALAVHRGFEAPVTRWLQRRLAPRPPSASFSRGRETVARRRRVG